MHLTGSKNDGVERLSEAEALAILGGHLTMNGAHSGFRSVTGDEEVVV